jgi:hypothetical protein
VPGVGAYLRQVMVSGASRRGRGACLSAVAGAWLAVLAVDLFVNAGLLANEFTKDDPVLLSGAAAARRIPVAYAAWLLQVGALGWLLQRLDVRGLRRASTYGAAAGVLAGALPLLALWTIVRLDFAMTVTWAGTATVEGAVAGLALAYLARTGGSGWRVLTPLILATVMTAFVIQNLR